VVLVAVGEPDSARSGGSLGKCRDGRNVEHGFPAGVGLGRCTGGGGYRTEPGGKYPLKFGKRASGRIIELQPVLNHPQPDDDGGHLVVVEGQRRKHRSGPETVRTAGAGTSLDHVAQIA